MKNLAYIRETRPSFTEVGNPEGFQKPCRDWNESGCCRGCCTINLCPL